jgi:hypothetical protein
VTVDQSVWRRIQENLYIYRYHCENLISCNVSWPTLVFRNVPEGTEKNEKTLYSGLSAAGFEAGRFRIMKYGCVAHCATEFRMGDLATRLFVSCYLF